MKIENYIQKYGGLQEKYNAWRCKMDETGVKAGYMTDCAFREARESFAQYCGLKEISLEEMLWYESKYDNERRMVTF